MISRANLPPQWSGSKRRLAQPVHLLRDSSPYFISRSMLPSRMHGPFFRFLPKAPSFGDGKQGKCGHTRKFCLSSGQIVPRNLVASQGLTLLFLVSAVWRVSKQMVNICFHGYSLAHIALCLPVFGIDPLLICRKSAAFFF